MEELNKFSEMIIVWCNVTLVHIQSFSIHLFAIVKFMTYKRNYKNSKTINGQLAKTINGRFG